MVVVNLYPFAQTVARPDCSLEDAVENIDIGGPTMVRSAAKNHKDVAIVVKSSDYAAIITEMDNNDGSLRYATRFDLAIKAFEHTAAYDSMIANYFGALVPAYHGETEQPSGRFPRTLNLNYIKKQDMRYGENSHQQAAFYIEEEVKEASVATAEQLQGKALSYNNIADTDAALECVKEFAEPACVIVKHANPCGVAIGDDILAAYERAYQTDPTSAFGGIIAFNRELDAATAQAIISRQFVEVIIAPNVTQEARSCWQPSRTCAGLRPVAATRGGAGLQTRQRRPAGAGSRSRHGDRRRSACGIRAPADRTGTARRAVLLESGQVREIQCHRLCT